MGKRIYQSRVVECEKENGKVRREEGVEGRKNMGEEGNVEPIEVVEISVQVSGKGRSLKEGREENER